MLFQLIIIQVVTFFAIVLVLRKLLYAETAREAKRLRRLKEENAEKEKELRQKIEEADSAYHEKVAKAEMDIQRLQQDTERELERARKELTNKAKEEADRIVSAAINAKEKMRDEVANEMRKKVPVLATQVFRDVLSAKARDLTHKELVREVINQIKTIEKSRFNVKIKKGELISAFPLGRADKNELLSVLARQMRRKMAFDEKEDKSLVAGLVIKLGTLVIDASLENRLRQVEGR